MKTIGLACDHAGFELKEYVSRLAGSKKAGLTKTSEQTLPQA